MSGEQTSPLTRPYSIAPGHWDPRRDGRLAGVSASPWSPLWRWAAAFLLAGQADLALEPVPFAGPPGRELFSGGDAGVPSFQLRGLRGDKRVDPLGQADFGVLLHPREFGGMRFAEAGEFGALLDRATA